MTGGQRICSAHPNTHIVSSRYLQKGYVLAPGIKENHDGDYVYMKGLGIKILQKDL